MRRTYEAWEAPGEVTLLPEGRAAEDKKRGLLAEEAVLLYRFEAATYEEAAAIHSLRMGHGPYQPMGEPDNCPKCGAWFYPEGSGECWRCG